MGGLSEKWEDDWQPIDVLYDRPDYVGDRKGGSCRIWPRDIGQTFYTADQAPDGEQAWIALAQDLRLRSIAVPPEHRVIFGGELVYTRLEDGGVEQRRIHKFDDQGQEFAMLLAGTANPLGAPHKWTGVGRNDPCPCGSGKKYKQCHLP
jgi:hypothetical protein